MQVYFEHKLQTDDIIVRQSNADNEFIEKNAGIYFPLVKINDIVLTFSDIISCDLEIGSTFLPKFTVTIDDSNYEIREQHINNQLSFLTVFIGNPRDVVYKPIKNTYLITEFYSEPGSTTITIESELFVPKLFQYKQKKFEGTSFDALQNIAKESDLGFVSNIKNTNDNMIWINPGYNYDWINDSILPGAYKTDKNSFVCFIDQFANLNFIDLKTASDSGSYATLETDVLTGTELNESVDLLLSNNRFRQPDDKSIFIQYYTPNNNYGELAKNRYTKLRYQQLQNDRISNTDYVEVENTKQIKNSTVKTVDQSVNCHDKYNIANYITKHNKSIIQGTELNLVLDYFAPSSFMYMTVPIEIYSFPRVTNKYPDSNIETLDNVQENESNLRTSSHLLVESLSGETIVTAIGYAFRKPPAVKNTEELSGTYRVYQTLTVFLKQNQ